MPGRGRVGTAATRGSRYGNLPPTLAIARSACGPTPLAILRPRARRGGRGGGAGRRTSQGGRAARRECRRYPTGDASDPRQTTAPARAQARQELAPAPPLAWRRPGAGRIVGGADPPSRLRRGPPADYIVLRDGSLSHPGPLPQLLRDRDECGRGLPLVQARGGD